MGELLSMAAAVCVMTPGPPCNALCYEACASRQFKHVALALELCTCGQLMFLLLTASCCRMIAAVCLQSYPLVDGTMSGKCPSSRSSHKTVVYNGRMIMYGGAVNPEGRDDKKERLGDMHTLCVKQGGRQVCWSGMDCPESEEGMPKGEHECLILHTAADDT